MSKPAVWKTKDGRLIPVSEMTDDHISNAMTMLERVAPDVAADMGLQALSYASSAPDGAAMAAEAEADDLLEGRYEVYEIFPVYRALSLELRRRQRFNKKQAKFSERTRKKLEAVGLGTIRISARGVPHIVFESTSSKISVAWFWKTKIYRCFWPYGSPGYQRKKDFKTAEEVQQFIRGFETGLAVGRINVRS